MSFKADNAAYEAASSKSLMPRISQLSMSRQRRRDA
jgi:hypothetical protein